MEGLTPLLSAEVSKFSALSTKAVEKLFQLKLNAMAVSQRSHDDVFFNGYPDQQDKPWDS